MSAKDGGAAFPCFEEPLQQWDEDAGKYRDVVAPFGGMSLRDYFAGQALSTVLAQADEQQALQFKAWANRCASVAYEIADAMLAERAKS